MSGRAQKPDWPYWRRQIQALAKTYARRYPMPSGSVALAAIAKARGISRFLFEPLPVAGGLAIEEDGFVMFVNCHEKEAGLWRQKMEDDSDGGMTLPVRARFTIAHEIAHTFFFNVNVRPPQPLLQTCGSIELQQLERLCNDGAGRLLIPDGAIFEHMPPGGVRSPAVLKNLTKRFRVSLQTLVFRLRSEQGWTERGGAIYLLAKKSLDGDGSFWQQLRSRVPYPVLACAVDGPMRSFLGYSNHFTLPAAAMRALELMNLEGRGNPQNYLIPSKIGTRAAIQPCEIACDVVFDDGEVLVVTMQLSGRPRLDGNVCDV